LQLTLHPDGVAAPALQAAATCREVVDLYFNALAGADLSKPPEVEPGTGPLFRLQFNGRELDAEQRRQRHESWILSKAFQDLMRGVRASLEEAYFFIRLMDIGSFRAEVSGTLHEVLQPFRDEAAGMNFPALLDAVNARLDRPLEFSQAYQSLQDARNCLEHRNGVVGQRDAKSDGKLLLQFPRMLLFVERDGKQVEILRGHVSQGEILKFKIDLRKREYEIGQRLELSAVDFEEIAFACSQFAGDLARNLPKQPAGLALPKKSS
jgi:hypothetical protein